MADNKCTNTKDRQGLSFYFICFWYVPNRMFTQQWMLILILAYTTEQVLFRKDPWEKMQHDEESNQSRQMQEEYSTDRNILDEWMKMKKPYLNADFKLLDLQEVLPMNRYRIEEAKHLLEEEPAMKMSDIAARSGFASQSVSTQVFSKETGLTPREWQKSN